LALARGDVAPLYSKTMYIGKQRYIKKGKPKANTSSHGLLQILLYSKILKEDGVARKYVEMI
jgi:hypothetical protein